jgi:hypothetical protein
MKKQEKEKEAFALRYKRWKLRAGYRWSTFKRNINFAYILFFLAIFLFAAVMIPNAVHRLPLPSEDWPFVFHLQGSVIYSLNASDPNSFQPVFNAKVEVGGYQTFTDSQGHFSVKFVSANRVDIPVLITWNNNSRIERITFDQNQFDRIVSFQLGA